MARISLTCMSEKKNVVLLLLINLCNLSHVITISGRKLSLNCNKDMTKLGKVIFKPA